MKVSYESSNGLLVLRVEQLINLTLLRLSIKVLKRVVFGVITISWSSEVITYKEINFYPFPSNLFAKLVTRESELFDIFVSTLSVVVCKIFAHQNRNT